MAEILGSLKIKHEQAIGGLILEADRGHGLEGGHEVGVAGAAAVDLEVSPKVAPDPGLEAKVDHVLGQKAGNLDQKANQSLSLIGAPVHALEAGLRMSMRNLKAGLVLDLVPPKKMEKVI
uniref:Serine and arginine rich splicing factor 6 n=1 Tax=Molossus molossus TaxID=27622 RepID=A0A7J8HKG3_MOLMO|nr:serine and arginine rich splicing factor 6 [Molossus molossus]